MQLLEKTTNDFRLHHKSRYFSSLVEHGESSAIKRSMATSIGLYYVWTIPRVPAKSRSCCGSSELLLNWIWQNNMWYWVKSLVKYSCRSWLCALHFLITSQRKYYGKKKLGISRQSLLDHSVLQGSAMLPGRIRRDEQRYAIPSNHSNGILSTRPISNSPTILIFLAVLK